MEENSSTYNLLNYSKGCDEIRFAGSGGPANHFEFIFIKSSSRQAVASHKHVGLHNVATAAHKMSSRISAEAANTKLGGNDDRRVTPKRQRSVHNPVTSERYVQAGVFTNTIVRRQALST